VIGLAVGLGGAVLSTRALASFLFETTPLDPVALASATLGLALAGGLAAWLPARKAALVDPVATLRSDSRIRLALGVPRRPSGRLVTVLDFRSRFFQRRQHRSLHQDRIAGWLSLCCAHRARPRLQPRMPVGS